MFVLSPLYTYCSNSVCVAVLSSLLGELHGEVFYAGCNLLSAILTFVQVCVEGHANGAVWCGVMWRGVACGVVCCGVVWCGDVLVKCS